MFESRFKNPHLNFLWFWWNLLPPVGGKKPHQRVDYFLFEAFSFCCFLFPPFTLDLARLLWSPWGQKVGTELCWSFVPWQHSSPEAAAPPRPGCSGVLEGGAAWAGGSHCCVCRTVCVGHSWRELGFLWGWGGQRRLAVHPPRSAKGVSVQVRLVVSPLPS